jgi:hypothetical protein
MRKQETNKQELKITVMKTRKIFISFLLATLTATGYGQIFGSEDHALLEAFKDRLFPGSKNDVFITVDYTTDGSGRIEAWISDVHGWVMDMVFRNDDISPVVTRTIYVDRADITFESDLRVENWMKMPFEADLAEEETKVEGWMSAPFETGVEEEELVLEEWMTSPFKSVLVEEKPAVEGWMSAAWK